MFKHEQTTQQTNDPSPRRRVSLNKVIIFNLITTFCSYIRYNQRGDPSFPIGPIGLLWYRLFLEVDIQDTCFDILRIRYYDEVYYDLTALDNA